MPDGRWQRGSEIDALYLADEEATAWAEWYRHLAELGVPPDQWLPTYLWTWKVDVEVADLSTEKRLRKVGLTSPRPGRRSWRQFQKVGEMLRAERWGGLLAPSAAHRGGLVLCLFRESSSVQGASPLPPPRKITAAPTPPTGMRT